MLPILSVAPASVLLIAGAYLIGSLSGARLLRRLVDRPGPGIAFDLAKGALAAWLALRHAPVGDPLTVTAHGYLAAFAALAGHVWPIWHRFRGGGGAAPLAGSLLVLWPTAAAICFVAGLLVWLRSGHMAFSVVLGGLCLPLLAWSTGAEPPRFWFAVCAALLLMLAHRGHLRRLWSGTEPRFARARRVVRWRRR